MNVAVAEAVAVAVALVVAVAVAVVINQYENISIMYRHTDYERNGLCFLTWITRNFLAILLTLAVSKKL